MKSYHENQVKNVNLDKPGTTPGALTSPHAPFGDPSAVSRGALALFRLIERLARRLGYAHVRIAPSELRPGKSLSEMLEKCARHIRRLLSELIALGWIARQCDGRMVYLKPLLRVIEAAKAPRVPAPKGAFLAAKMSGLMSGLKRENVRSHHLHHTTETNKGDHNTGRNADRSQNACPVTVSLLREVCSEIEALELAREATRHQLTEGQVKRVLEAYKGQLANIRNRGAWLREALRRGFSPAAPLSTHASDQGGAPVAKIVRIPKDQPFWGSPCAALVATGGTDQALPVKADSVSCGPQPGQIGSPRGIDILRAQIAARKAGLA